MYSKKLYFYTNRFSQKLWLLKGVGLVSLYDVLPQIESYDGKMEATTAMRL